MYDIIGDIHGEAKKLHKLLRHLGYTDEGGFYHHQKRKAIFLGDFINKGPDTLEVLQMVRAMVTHDAAHAVLGNHEFYLIGFFHEHGQGAYIREHTEKNINQHAPTFSSFGQDMALLKEYIDWLKTLPLFMELEGLRVVHAYWHQQSIDYFQKHYPQHTLSNTLIKDLVPDSLSTQAVEELLVGVKLMLPASGNSVAFKSKWWKIGKTHQYQELAIRPEAAIGNPFIGFTHIDTSAYHYPENEKPLFFGHYNLPGKPRLLAPNYCCLDFNLKDERLIVAYRWDGEQKLKKEKLEYV